jgi:glycosyltransferase involved in cell wall biosynthesis
MSRPTFSIVVPTWNDAALLPRALESVLHQTLSDFELIVVDDGSTDATRETLEGLRDPRLHTLHQRHAGVSAARNRGLRQARGRWVTFLDSDDEALPCWLETLYPATREPRAGIISCGLQLVRPESDSQSEPLLPGTDRGLFHHLPVLFLTGAFAVERLLLESVGGYTEALSYSENTDLGIRLSDRCVAEGRRVIPVPRPLVRYHLRPEAEAQRSRSRCERRLEGVRYFLEHHREALARHPETLGSFFALGGVLAARLGLRSESRRFFRQGLALDPWRWMTSARLAVSLIPGLARWVWPEPEGP